MALCYEPIAPVPHCSNTPVGRVSFEPYTMSQQLRQTIYDTVIEANRKMTPGEVTRVVSQATGVDKEVVKLAMRDLVSQGELSYTYVYGRSFLEKSFDRPFRVSARIVIKPPQKVYQAQPGDVVVDIATGAAFGDGAHPTTCLSLRALDSVLAHGRYLRTDNALKGLDVGTGTGILAIALAMLGIEEVIGIDVDPCAVSEATNNVFLNGLAERVTITSMPLQRLTAQFSVIVANLAYPTLRRLSLLLSEKMEPDGILVLSGFKEPVAKDLRRAYTGQGLSLIQEETQREWVCFALRKEGQAVKSIKQKSSA
jgi:ribosomal protein L11 methyltransferase